MSVCRNLRLRKKCPPLGWLPGCLKALALLSLLLPALAGAATLTNLASILSLTKEEIERSKPTAEIEGVVSIVIRGYPFVFVHAGTNGIMVVTPDKSLASGTLVRVGGEVGLGDFAPYVAASKLEAVGPGEIPKGSLLDRSQNPGFGLHGHLVAVEGFVHDLVVGWGNVTVLLDDGARHVSVLIQVPPDFSLPLEWRDAKVRAQGVYWPKSDDRGRFAGFDLHSPSTRLLEVLEPGRADVFDYPTLPLGLMGKLRDVEGRRLKTRGVVSHASRDGRFYIESDGAAASVTPLAFMFNGDRSGQSIVRPDQSTLLPGDVVEILAKPDRHSPSLAFVGAEWKRVGRSGVPPATPASPSDLMKGELGGKRVKIRGKLAAREGLPPGGAYDERLILLSDDLVFSALLENRTRADLTFKDGDWLEIEGLNQPEMGVGRRVYSFSLLVSNLEEVRLTKPPPLWERAMFVRVAGIGGGILALGGLWIFAQSRQMQRLRSAQEQFHTLMDHSFDSTLVLEPSGVVKYISPGGERLLGTGHQAEPFIKEGRSSLIVPEDLPLVLQIAQKLLAEPRGRSGLFSYRIRAADGTRRTVEAVATNCLKVRGVEGLVLNIRDITERLKADETARRSEAFTRTLNAFATSLLERDTEEEILWDLAQNCVSQLGFVDCVIYLVDAEKGVLVQKAALGPKSPGGGVILNPIQIPFGQGIVGSVASSRIPARVGDTSADPRYIVDDAPRLSEIAVPIVSKEELLGVIDSEHPDKDFFTEDHLNILTAIAALCANRLTRARAQEELRAFNATLERRIDERTTALMEEVSARKRAEIEMRLALEAEKELNQLKGNFVSMVSHEFRTPLGVILSSSNILDRYLDRLPADKRKTQLRAIRKSVHRMNDLVEDILLLGKFDAGRMTCNPSPVNLDQVCRKVVAEVESACGREQAILFDMDPGAGDAVGDETLLLHILVNLLGNALKYSTQENQVRFGVRRLGSHAEFTIQDFGCGIPSADQGRLFTAFYRGSNVSHTQGSGLGLVIVKRCVDLHAGSIHCQSVEGEGTSFTVTLPLFGETDFYRRVAPPIPDPAA